MKAQASPFGLGESTAEPHTFPLVFAPAAPNCKTASHVVAAQSSPPPALPGRCVWPWGKRVAGEEGRGGERREGVAGGCCRPEEAHVATAFVGRHIYQVQTPYSHFLYFTGLCHERG